MNVTLLTYSIAAKDLGTAIRIIARKKDNLQFAIRIGQGTARLSESISLARKERVLLLGHLPTNSTDSGTTIDLPQRYIHIENCNVCFQDLRLTNGKVLGTCNLNLRQRVCEQGESGGAINAAGTIGAAVFNIQLWRCRIDHCNARVVRSILHNQVLKTCLFTYEVGLTEHKFNDMQAGGALHAYGRIKLILHSCFISKNHAGVCISASNAPKKTRRFNVHVLWSHSSSLGFKTTALTSLTRLPLRTALCPSSHVQAMGSAHVCNAAVPSYPPPHHTTFTTTTTTNTTNTNTNTTNTNTTHRSFTYRVKSACA